MVKHFNIIMAAFISGTVALFTSVLGVSGTIIGSVLSSFLYQLLSGYSEEKIEEGTFRKPKLANEIVYVFPLVVIGIIELIFLLSSLHYRFDMIFDILESAVANNLFRLMGIGLIILGAYPYFNSNNIDKRNGTVVLIVGVLLLLRGLMDISDLTAKIFYAVFAQFDVLFALFVIIALTFVILNIIIASDKRHFKNRDFSNGSDLEGHSPRKIDTSFGEDSDFGEDIYSSYDDGFRYGNGSECSEDYSNPDGSYGGYVPDEESYEGYALGDNENKDSLPLYEEEIILVNNPDDPENPIRKRILKRVKSSDFNDKDDYEDVYIFDED